MTVNDGIALVGCGAWGANIAAALAELGALRLICDADEARGGAVAAKLGVAFTTQLDEVIARDDIIGVAVATPAVTHSEVATRLLEAGKHVFVEKPIALSIADAEAMTALAKKVGRVLMVGHLLQYHPVFVKLKQLVADGELGSLQYVSSNRLNQGKIRSEENALWSLAPHDLSMVLALAGAAPSRIEAVGHAAVQPGIEDLSVVHMSFPNGLRAQVYCSWLNPIKEHRLTVVGDRAMAVFEDTAGAWEDKLIIYRHEVDRSNGVPQFNKGAAERISVTQTKPLTDELAHFLECIRSGLEPRTGAMEAIPVLQALTDAQQSMEERAHR